MLALDALGHLAAQAPERPLVSWRGGWVSAAELSTRGWRTMAKLRRLGVRAGDRVGVLAQNHLAILELFVAAPRLGFVLAPLNHRLSAPELAAAVAQLSPALLVTTAEFEPLARTLGPTVLDVDALTEDDPAPQAAPAVGLDAPAMLLFTGGTTGRLKAAIISHRQLRLNALNTTVCWRLSAADAVILATPMFHAALHVLATPLLLLGGRVLIQERFDAGEYLAWVEAHGVTRLFLVPTMYQLLAGHPRFAVTRFGSVVEAISGGAPCPRPIRDEFARRGVAFRQGYGLTEAGVNCFTMSTEEAAEHPDSVGRPMPDLATRLVAHGRDVAPGEVGELWLGGPMVMDGYFGQPEATRDVLVEEGGQRWLRTGDLARQDAAGRWFIVGRQKEMFISGGENVFPVEVERVLLDHPEVAECVVLGVPSATWGEEGLALVVARPGSGLEPEALRAFAAARLARYKVPKRIVLRPALPRTGAGKIDKAALQAEFTR